LYLCAVTQVLRTNPRFDLQALPPSIEGFFRSATSDLGDNEILGDTLRTLSAARAPLSLRDLSRIAGKPQREVFDRGIQPIRAFLLELNGGYTFYHARFHEFVTRTMFYEDELQAPHRKIAAWLQLPECWKSEYRLTSLAYHFFASGDYVGLTQAIDESFLAEKVQRLGYAVLEDIELWTRALLELEDPALVTRCVSLVESLRHIVGGDIIRDVARAVQPYQAGPASFRTHLMETSLRSVPGLDVYSGILPKGEVTADFVEIIPWNGGLVLAIGDAPAVGLKSAFVASFLGNLFHKLVERGVQPVQLDQVLVKLKQTVRNEEYFSHVSMQCAALDPTTGVLRFANASHPYPVHYSARRGKCDILPLRGGLFRDLLEEPDVPAKYEEYRIKVGIGDVIVFLTDGLLEDHVIAGEPYGYRFTEIMISRAKDGARAIGEAILDDWRTYPREEDSGDDVSIIVVTVV
jgi:phosphoserine phosphatase RsbU/P